MGVTWTCDQTRKENFLIIHFYRFIKIPFQRKEQNGENPFFQNNDLISLKCLDIKNVDIANKHTEAKNINKIFCNQMTVNNTL